MLTRNCKLGDVIGDLDFRMTAIVDDLQAALDSGDSAPEYLAAGRAAVEDLHNLIIDFFGADD